MAKSHTHAVKARGDFCRLVNLFGKLDGGAIRLTDRVLSVLQLRSAYHPQLELRYVVIHSFDGRTLYMNTTISVGQEEYLGGDMGRILEHHIKLLMQHLIALRHSEYDIFETLPEERRGRILLLASVLCCEIESLYHQISENPSLSASSESDEDLAYTSVIFNKSPNRRLS